MNDVVHSLEIGPNNFKVTYVRLVPLDLSSDRGEILDVTGGKIIQGTDCLTTPHQLSDNVRAYKACSSGNQIVGHRFNSDDLVMIRMRTSLCDRSAKHFA